MTTRCRVDSNIPTSTQPLTEYCATRFTRAPCGASHKIILAECQFMLFAVGIACHETAGMTKRRGIATAAKQHMIRCRPLARLLISLVHKLARCGMLLELMW